jgi:hypothetical protein
MFLLKIIAKLIAWDYKRGTWQHEFLCLAYIAALIFIPTNSNGWFTEGEIINLEGGTSISLQRFNTTLFLFWEEGTPEPQPRVLHDLVEHRFGKDTDLVRDPDLGPRHYRIIPRGLR